MTAPRVIGAVGTTLAVVVAVSGRFSAGSLALAAVIVTISRVCRLHRPIMPVL